MPKTKAGEPPTAAAVLLAEIESFLVETGYSASKFGKDAVGDVNLVFDLRKSAVAVPDAPRSRENRALTLPTVDKIHAFMRAPSKRRA